MPLRFATVHLRSRLLLCATLAAITPTMLRADDGDATSKQAAFTERDISFGKKRWKLPGKLSLPASDKPVPCVVLVHGSGPNDEDETIGPNKPFRDIAEGLSSHGIAVLRYRKRTRAHGAKMMGVPITVRDEVIDDALLAIKFARKQKEIDPKRVYLLGHSLGGMLAPEIATEDAQLAGIVILSGTSRSLLDVIEEQLNYIAGLTSPQQKANQKARDEVLPLLKKMRDGEKVEGNLLGAPIDYWLDVETYAARCLDRAKALKCPILVIGGGRDYQVTRKDFDIWQTALKDRSTVAFKWYPELHHLMMPGKGEGLARPDEYAIEGKVDERVIKDVGAWIVGK